MGGGGSALAAAPATVLGATAEAKERTMSTDKEARAAEDVADELDAAVIALGSRDLKGMKKILGGSVSQQVAEHAGRPVPIVPPR
jgi:nucleotide-binding universal stress UspA family protein